MAAGSTNRVRWAYTCDNGAIFAVSADSYITAQGGVAPVVGGGGANLAVENEPGRIKKRVVLCRSSTGHSREVTLYEKTAPLATAGTTIMLNTLQADGTENEVEYTSSGKILPEGRGVRVPLA